MLTHPSYHFQLNPSTRIRECERISSDAVPHSISQSSSSPERIRSSIQNQTITGGRSHTSTPISLRRRIRSQQASIPTSSSTLTSRNNQPATFLPYPILSIDPTTLRMSRPTSSSTTSRPTHIPLPNNNFTPTGTPLATPPIGSAASPASPRHSFLGFMRTRGRANTLNTSSTPSQPPASPSLDRDRSRNASSREGSTAGMSRENTNTHTAINTGGSVTRSISTPSSGGGLNISTNTDTNGNGHNPGEWLTHL
ncbi:hypothetical protein V866_000173 [Kwoniella sp. B9012]